MTFPRWGETDWKPIPQNAYDRFKHGFLDQHIWVHYILHCTYCLVMGGARGGYKWFTPSKWQASMIESAF